MIRLLFRFLDSMIVVKGWKRKLVFIVFSNDKIEWILFEMV